MRMNRAASLMRAFRTKAAFDNKRSIVFVGVNALLAPLTAGVVFVIARTGKDLSMTVRLITLLVFLEILIVTVLFFSLFRRTIATSNKLQKIYDTIPLTHRIGVQKNRTSPEQMLDDIMDYHTMLQNKELLTQYALSQSKLSALQSQINPHFLFNTLESIRGYCFLNGQTEVEQVIEALSFLFRNCLQRIGILIPLKEELENVARYIALQQFRFPGKFVYREQLEEDERLLHCMVPNLTIQPIIENAIFHGLENKVGVGEIFLRAYLTEKRLVIQVSDNGLGIESEDLAKIHEMLKKNDAPPNWRPNQTSDSRDRGIGMMNINLRIRLRFGNEYGITIASTKNVGTEVNVVLPINL